MKFDYYSATVWGRDENGPSGTNLFDEDVAFFASEFRGTTIERLSARNGYEFGCSIRRGEDQILACFTGGSGGAARSSHFEAASSANEVYPVFKSRFPDHMVSRVDVAEDYTGEGAWEKLEALITRVCHDYGVSMAPYGEGHLRPDGTRDALKGRSWYCGSKSSPFRAVLYEKGKEQLSKGVLADPNWVRLEIRVRPQKEGKAFIGSTILLPAMVMGCSRWGKRLGELIGVEDIQRLQIGSIWRPTELDRLALKIVRMFDSGIERLIEEDGLTPEEFGKLIFSTHQVYRESQANLKMMAA